MMTFEKCLMKLNWILKFVFSKLFRFYLEERLGLEKESKWLREIKSRH